VQLKTQAGVQRLEETSPVFQKYPPANLLLT
jgi:hypothetical protein